MPENKPRSRHYDSFDAGPEWGTPRYIVKPLADSIVNGFDLDPASGAEPVPYATERFTKEDDGLAQDWFGDVWLNPPYGRNHNPEWGEKTLNEWQSGRVNSITALVPASTETDWFQSNYAKADMLTFLGERVEFIGAGDSGASFPSVIVTFGPGNLHRNYIKALRELGQVYPKTEKVLKSLVESGASAPAALDYYFTHFSDYSTVDWAEVRDVSQPTVVENRQKVEDGI